MKNPNCPVHLDNGYGHVADDADRSNPPGKSQDQHQATEELDANRQEGKGSRNSQLPA
jgi:hypothetical protein